MPADSTDTKAVLDTMDVGVFALGADGKVVCWSAGAERLTGQTADAMIGAPPPRILPLPPRKKIDPTCPAVATLRDGVTRRLDASLGCPGGAWLSVRVRITPLGDMDAPSGVVVVFHENSEKLALLQRIAELEQTALLDPLTGVANRRFVEDHLNVCMDQNTRYGWPFGLIFMDIDRFKAVNDEYGHEAGDQVLKHLAHVLDVRLRSFDLVGRWGGEEFIVICLNVGETDLRELAGRLREYVEAASFDYEGRKIAITVSIGATYPRREDTVRTLIQRADGLMYQSKQAGRNRVTFGE